MNATIETMTPDGASLQPLVKNGTREKPILFSGEMVRAILAGRKTQTRRAINPQPAAVEYWRHGERSDSRNGLPIMRDGAGDGWSTCGPFKCPYIPPGMYASFGGELKPQVGGDPIIASMLWVKETHAPHPEHPLVRCAYKADMKSYGLDNGRATASEDSLGTVLGAPVSNPAKPWGGKWKPSIYMRRCYSRITLEITHVRVERVQDITEADAKAEGVTPGWRDKLKSESCKDDQKRSYSIAFGELWASINGLDSWKANPWVWVVTFNRVFNDPSSPTA